MARPTTPDIFLKQPDLGFCLQCPELSFAFVASPHSAQCHVSAKLLPGDMPHRKSVRDEVEIVGRIQRACAHIQRFHPECTSPLDPANESISRVSFISLACRDLMVEDFAFPRSKLPYEQRQTQESRFNLESFSGVLYPICLHRLGG
jgi:hypothetical protein